MAIDPVLCWAFGGAGVFAQGVAFMLARRPLRLIRAGGRARGRIGTSEGRMIASSKGPSRMAYFPSVAFTTGTGEKVSFTSASGWATAPDAGGEVAVLYDPASPKDAEISSFRTFWLFPVATAVMGLPFLLVGLACLL